VRQLERSIGKACRKVATLVAENADQVTGDASDEDVDQTTDQAADADREAGNGAAVEAEAKAGEAAETDDAEEKETSFELPIEVDAEKVREYLGKPRYRFEAALRTEKPGVATGLAWTPTGGEVLFVEAAAMPGSEEQLIMTGQLGDVMRESARIALSYVESHQDELGVSREKGKGKIHLHVPAGAVPKDGPSAGITMVTALVSLLSGRPVDANVGMTGEVTLQGQVLPIGGLKLKALAAHRAGLKKVIVPKMNEVDIDEIPDKIREEMEFVLVEDIPEVLEHALAPVEDAASTEEPEHDESEEKVSEPEPVVA
jgi:ATP-dependent Lon protease